MSTFQLYNEVQARRGVNDTTSQNQKTGIDGCHGKGLFATDHLSKSHPGAMTNGLSHQNGYGVSEIEDLLQDYLGQGKGASRKNNGARHVVSRGKALCLLHASIGICTSEEIRYVDVLEFCQGRIDYSLLVPSCLLTQTRYQIGFTSSTFSGCR